MIFKKTNSLSLKLLSSLTILSLGFSLVGEAVVIYGISEVVIKDNGSLHTLNSSSTYTPVGDADLQSFTTSGTGGTTYDTTGYVSGVRVDSSAINAPGVIQPSNFLVTNDPKFTDGNPNSQFYTGSSQMGSFLAHGERGLSLSTAINVTQDDAPADIRFNARIKDFSLLTDGIPDFVFGDGANNQSDDEVRFLDANGNVLLSFTMNGTSNGNGDPATDWSSLGTRDVDRIKADGTDFRATTSNDETLQVNMIAVSIEESDLTAFGIGLGTFADAMAAVREIAVDIPGTSAIDDPRTDYAFFGINLNAIESDAAVVPEPKLYSLICGILSLAYIGSRRQRRRS